MYRNLPDGDTRLVVLGRDIKYISRLLSHWYIVGHGLKSMCFAQASLLSLGTALDNLFPLTVISVTEVILARAPRALEGEVKGGSSLEGAGKGRLWRKGSRKGVD
jgi:hypothetical protein